MSTRCLDVSIQRMAIFKEPVQCPLMTSVTLMLYSLCMKFQAELVNFQDQLENRVLCKTFPSRQNSEVHPSVTTHKELKNVFE